MAAECAACWSWEAFWLGVLVTGLCIVGSLLCLLMAVKWPPRYLDEYEETIVERRALRGEK